MRTFAQYREILQKKGWRGCFHELMKAVWPIWWTRNKAIIEQIQADRASKYLWRKYKSLIVKPLNKWDENSCEGKKIMGGGENDSSEKKGYIWVIWLQGREQAPEIVKACMRSIEVYMPDYRLTILTEKNMREYVSLPDEIWRRYEEKRIAFAHFSDIVRTALMAQKGGIYLDATVLLTNRIPETITNAPLFMFQRSVLSNIPHLGSNWFIVAKKGNPIMKRQLELLCEYYGKEKGLVDYFLYHLLLYLVCTKNEEARKMVEEMPYIPNVDVHTMQFALGKSFDEAKWKQMIERSDVHKLSYKLRPIPNEGTFYGYIVKGIKKSE